MVKRQIQNFDYYSKYNGETGIQFTAFSEGDVAYIFSIWTGYSDFLFEKLLKNQDQGFPVFLKNWNQQTGWIWDSIPDKISEKEKNWLIIAFKNIKSELKLKPEEVGYFDINCLFDLIFFLESTKKLKLRLEISDDY